MYGVVGTLLLAAGAVLFGWALVSYQRPDAARWTRSEFLGMAIVVATTGFLAFGVAVIIQFLASFDQLRAALVELVLMIAIVAAAFAAIRALRVRWRRLTVPAGRSEEPQLKLARSSLGHVSRQPDFSGRPRRGGNKARRARRRKAA